MVQTWRSNPPSNKPDFGSNVPRPARPTLWLMCSFKVQSEGKPELPKVSRASSPCWTVLCSASEPMSKVSQGWESRISGKFSGGSMIFMGNHLEIGIFLPWSDYERPPPAFDSCRRKTTCPFSVSVSKACDWPDPRVMVMGCLSLESNCPTSGATAFGACVWAEVVGGFWICNSSQTASIPATIFAGSGRSPREWRPTVDWISFILHVYVCKWGSEVSNYSSRHSGLVLTFQTTGLVHHWPFQTSKNDSQFSVQTPPKNQRTPYWE